MRLAAAFSIAILALAVPLRADWTITDASFQDRHGQVDSFDDKSIRAGDNTLDWADVIELQQALPEVSPAAAPGQFDLYTLTGDRLSGAPIAMTGDSLQWNSPLLGKIELPISHLAAIAPSGAAPPALTDSRTDDALLLANGDATHGIIAQVDQDGVHIQTDDTQIPVPWSAIKTVLFSSPPGGAIPTERSFRIAFADGQAVTAPSVSLADGKLTIHLTSSIAPAVDAADVLSIEELNGPISWLTGRAAAQSIYKPYFTENFPTRIDRTVDGALVTDRYPQFHHGIGCHAYSKQVYALDGSFAAFRTQFVVDSDSALADVTVRVLLDDRVVFEKKNAKAGQVSPVLVIPLNSAKTLSLEVDYGENYATQGRFVWLDPALLREAPATQPSTEPSTQP